MTVPDGETDKTAALSEQILDNARKQAKKILDRAERESKKIRSGAEEEGKKESDEIMARARMRAETERRKISATTPLAVKRRMLEAQEAILNAVLEAGLHAAAEEAAKSPETTLALLILNSVLIMHEDHLIVEVGEQDKGRVSPEMLSDVVAQVKQRQGRSVVLSLAKQPVPIAGGVIVWSESGHLVCDNSLEARLERSRDDLRLRLAELLFEEEEAADECG